MIAIDFQKNNFAALSVGDILQYYLLPAALRNEFSESLYHTSLSDWYNFNFTSAFFQACSPFANSHPHSQDQQ